MLRFEHEKSRWREELTIQMTLKLLDVRLAEYAPIWTHVSTVARNMMDEGTLTPDLARELATKIKDWRYAKGGLLADEATRVSAYNLQQLLSKFDGKDDSFEHIHNARRQFRDALRADMGLSENARDTSIIDKVKKSSNGSEQKRLGDSPEKVDTVSGDQRDTDPEILDHRLRWFLLLMSIPRFTNPT
jgi:hypothetical protein